MEAIANTAQSIGMKPEQAIAGRSNDLPVLTRAALRAQIEALLEGNQTAKQLAAWAFNQFYAYDTETLLFEQDAEDIMSEALDTLMFADDPAFALGSSELQALLTQLQP